MLAACHGTTAHPVARPGEVSHPLFTDLRGLVAKASGIPRPTGCLISNSLNTEESAFTHSAADPELSRKNRDLTLDVSTRRIRLHLADPAELQAAIVPDDPADAKSLRILRRPDPVVAAQPAVIETTTPRAPAAHPPPPPPKIQIGDVFEVTVDKAESVGVFVSWDTGRGLVPGAELGVPRNSDLRRQFPKGMTFRAAVMNIRDDGKIAVSRTAVDRAEERARTDAYVQQAGSPTGKGLATLGDLLQKFKKD